MPKVPCDLIVAPPERMRKLERNRPSERKSCLLAVASAAEPGVAAVAEAAVAVGTTESAAVESGMKAQAVVGPEKRETEVSEVPEVAAAVVVAAGQWDIR
jgi:hypothetical protein